jgi:predicted DNA-binding ribbon-helix-helix protein
MGENTFEAWCNSVGLTANRSQIDKTGWDYLVEFPLEHAGVQAADLSPPALECRVQVKASDKCRRRLNMSLQNLERLVKTSIPTFVCVLEFDGMDAPQRAYLIHLGEEILRRTLKRLRRLEATSCGSTHQPSLSIAYGNPEKLVATNGACLKQAIEAHVPKGTQKYQQWKSQLLKTVGYEDRHGYMRVQISGCDPITDLIDLSLGLRKNLQVNKISIHDTRFGIDRVLHQSSEGGHISVGPAILKGSVHFREKKSSPGVEFSANVHNPSVNRVVPRDRVTFRLETQFFEILIEPFNDTLEFKLLPEVNQTRASLSALKDFLRLLCMLGAHGNEGVWMEVRVDDRPFLPEGRILPADMQAPKEELETVQQALEVARIYEIDRRVSVSLDDLIVSRRRIKAFYHMVEDPREELTATFFVDNCPQSWTPAVSYCGHISRWETTWCTVYLA